MVEWSAESGTLLFDSAFRLQGCGAPECAPEIPFGFPRISRAVLEWTTVSTSSYAAGLAKTDVVCRAMAATSGMGSVQLSSAGPVVRHWDMMMSVLRVGDFNPLFDSTSLAASFPSGRNGTSSSTRDQFTPRQKDGGKVVLTDALTPAIFWFDPRTLLLNKSTATLARPRIGATSTAIGPTTSQTVTGDSVLIASGAPDAGPSTPPAADADLFTLPATIVPAIPLMNSHGFTAAVSVPSMKTLGNAVVIAGGCNADASNPSSYVEAIFMSPPPTNPDLTKCSYTSSGQLVCALYQLENGGCRLGSARMVGPGSRVAWFGAGVQGNSSLGDSQYLSSDSIITFGVPFPDMFGRPGSAGPGVTVNIVMGGSDGTTSGRNQIYVVGTDLTVAPASAGTLKEGRGLPRASYLEDGSVLVTGGLGGMTQAPLESAEQIEFLPAITPRYLAKPGRSCTSGSEADCVHMIHPRWNHTATMIDGTTGWLNGAVLIAHGIGDYPPELFVPAYYQPMVGANSMAPQLMRYLGKPGMAAATKFAEKFL